MMRRPSLTASIGPSTVLGFIAAMSGTPSSDALKFHYPSGIGPPEISPSRWVTRRLRRRPVVDIRSPHSVGPDHLAHDSRDEKPDPPDARARNRESTERRGE